ncbi:MAG: riboflavin synthase [Actinomycetota bacterium]
MFTGIVTELGEVVQVVALPQAARLTVRAGLAARLAPGGSVAVDGVCLTVVTTAGGEFTADVMAQTLSLSTLGRRRRGDVVNLEPPVTLATPLGGHLVQGHVDGTGPVLDRTPAEHWETVRIGLPAPLAGFLVPKGSIAVDGVSLTVADLGEGWFSVGLIPTTLRETTLGRRAVGEPVNLEVDLLAKYVARQLALRRVPAEDAR